MTPKLVLVVVDGMTPAAFERAVESGRAPALAFLAEHGDYRLATSVFPSLTPVCLTSIATGAGPGVHHIPSLVWWSRQERRIVEYGSSFAALRAAGLSQSLLDPIFNMNERHLAPGAVTIYEALEDAGLVAAAVNITCYRGRHRHLTTLPGVSRAAFGPTRFFFYGLFESDRTGAPFAVRSRRAGSVDTYAAAVGRWLVTRDGFDFLAFYLSGYDFASHAGGPGGAEADRALEQVDVAIGGLFEAAGGPDEVLERYAVVLLSDHGQTAVDRGAREPQGGRAAGLGSRGVGARRSRRPSSRGRWQSRLARRRRFGRPARHGRHRSRAAANHRGRSRGARALRRGRAAVDGGDRRCSLTTARRWSSGSSAGAAFRTSGCSPRWDACRASSSCLPSCGRPRMRMPRCRSAAGRRSRSPTWWR